MPEHFCTTWLILSSVLILLLKLVRETFSFKPVVLSEVGMGTKGADGGMSPESVRGRNLLPRPGHTIQTQSVVSLRRLRAPQTGLSVLEPPIMRVRNRNHTKNRKITCDTTSSAGTRSGGVENYVLYLYGTRVYRTSEPRLRSHATLTSTSLLSTWLS